MLILQQYRRLVDTSVIERVLDIESLELVIIATQASIDTFTTLTQKQISQNFSIQFQILKILKERIEAQYYILKGKYILKKQITILFTSNLQKQFKLIYRSLDKVSI